MKFTNYIFMGKEFVKFADLNEKEKEEICRRLNEAALKRVGYERMKEQVDNQE